MNRARCHEVWRIMEGKGSSPRLSASLKVPISAPDLAILRHCCRQWCKPHNDLKTTTIEIWSRRKIMVTIRRNAIEGLPIDLKVSSSSFLTSTCRHYDASTSLWRHISASDLKTAKPLSQQERFDMDTQPTQMYVDDLPNVSHVIELFSKISIFSSLKMTTVTMKITLHRLSRIKI